MKCNCILIGGGASALFLAAQLNMNGQPGGGLIIEKTGKCGTKLLMSGGGRCNITHGGSIKDFISAYEPSGPKLRKCLYRHSNAGLAAWLEESGIPLADENGASVYSYDLGEVGRIFPASMKASDILELLLGKAKANGWEIQTGAAVTGIEQFNAGDGTDERAAALSYGTTADGDNSSSLMWKVYTETRGNSVASAITARNVIIASGGITYPETGSDGSMFRALESLGVQIVPLRSALAPVYVEKYPYEELSGISLDDVTVTVFESGRSGGHGRMSARMTGSILFTHRGFSGPVILNISKYAGPGCTISLCYNKELSKLPRRLQRILESRSRGPSGDLRTTALAALLRSDDFTVSSVDEHGMVSAGGIFLEEIDMKSMQLKRFPGLYAIGEAIDADGITGGYNLQMCWSTACTAADNLSRWLPSDSLRSRL